MNRFVIVVLCALLAVVAAGPRRKKPSASDGKIVGGRDTDINRVPYLVSLQYKREHLCGGSLITPKHVLTAAHCVERGRPSDYLVRMGSTYHATGGEIKKVSKIISHPNYNPENVNYDAAILELSEPVTSSKVRTISLADSEPKPGEHVLVSGWGARMEGGHASKNLQSVVVPVVSRQTCQKILQTYNTVTENMWCAGFTSGGRDACQGDSGGPALVNGRQAGIVSWGNGCAKKNTPGVYTNVPKIKPWIQAQTRGYSKSNN